MIILEVHTNPFQSTSADSAYNIFCNAAKKGTGMDQLSAGSKHDFIYKSKASLDKFYTCIGLTILA